MTDPTGDALKASAAQVPALTKTQIETLSNNIHNVNDYAYTIECLTYHLGAAALSPVEQAPQPVADIDYRPMKEALFAGIDTGRDKIEYGGVLTKGGKAWITFEVRPTEASHIEQSSAAAILTKIAGEPAFSEPFKSEDRILSRDDMIILARSATSATPTEAPPVESRGAGWQSMETAPKDGTKFVALERWPSGNIYARVYEWTGRPNYWSSKRDGVCIRPDYQDRYMWVPLPPALAAEGSTE